MNIGAVGSNPLLSLISRTQNAGANAGVFAPVNTNAAANSAGPLSILPSSSAQPLSFESILALQSVGEDEEPAQLTEMTATEKFLKEAQKTPMERMREQVLAGLGLSEDALSQMPPDERRAAEDKVRELIEEKVRQGMNGGDKSPASNAEMMEQVA
ncbi:MAG: hypothetical protein NT015_02435 [Alphaproteobacteria bacterium]|nr:hypothetical protein [Alphaproteobacteria bacterium]